MDEFNLFAVKSKKANKTNSSIRFLGESMVRQSAFEINWSLFHFNPIVNKLQNHGASFFHLNFPGFILFFGASNRSGVMGFEHQAMK